MSFWLAGATVVSAGVAVSSANKTRKSAEKQGNAELAFQQEQYDDWQEVYGPIQDNLAEYYGNLDAAQFETQGLEAFETERALTETRISEMLAQRGITDSGIAVNLELQEDLSAARTRAGIRQAAPAQAAAQKLNFLQVGLGQDPSAGLENTLARRTQYAQGQAANAEAQAGEAVSSAITSVGTALSNYKPKSGGQ